MLLADCFGKYRDDVAAPDYLDQGADRVRFDSDSRSNRLRPQIVVNVLTGRKVRTQDPEPLACQHVRRDAAFF